MASSGKGKGSVRTVEWWKHLRHRKRDQQKRVRSDGKQQCGDTDLEDPLLEGVPFIPMSEEQQEIQRRAYEANKSLYKQGILKRCPQCSSERPKHKMDCGIRWEERHVRE